MYDLSIGMNTNDFEWAQRPLLLFEAFLIYLWCVARSLCIRRACPVRAQTRTQTHRQSQTPLITLPTHRLPPTSVIKEHSVWCSWYFHHELGDPPCPTNTPVAPCNDLDRTVSYNKKAVLSQRWPRDAPTKVNKQPHLHLRSRDSRLTQFNRTLWT